MKKFLFSLSAAAILLTACNNDDDKITIEREGELKGNITADRTLNADTTYLLTGTLSVKEGAKLTIPAGTVIKGSTSGSISAAYSKYIIVERGAQIDVQGTEDQPVVMTSEDQYPGGWGGLIINGYAPISGANEDQALNEGSTEVNSNIKYGGDQENDNSGSVQYLILEYTGAKSSEDKEHNGLTLNGVGNGTTVENIYVKHGADDGIEWFGGSVNVTNLLVVNSDDDMFDVTEGWTGTLDNAYGIWEPDFVSSEGDPRGVEADGNLDGNGPTHFYQSDFTMTNITIVTNAENSDDSGENGFGGLMHDALKIRRGARATITNCIVKGIGTIRDLVDLTDQKGYAADGTSIELNYADLATDLTGEIINGEGEVNASINVEAAGLTGCDTSVFGWTGYSFN